MHMRPSPVRRSAMQVVSAALGIFWIGWTASVFVPSLLATGGHHVDAAADAAARLAAEQCRQADALFPSQKSPALGSMDEYLASPQFLQASVPRLAGAVQVRTESFDDMDPVGVDPRWDVMYNLAAYLEQTFPLVYSTLRLEKVNTHGLLYTWTGSDTGLRPTVLMAHQDTVPVEPSTISQWTHPPFSGEFDGHYLWGRGSADTKNTLVGILEAVELLIEAGFSPKRTVVISFGFDEESAGREGAGNLAEVLLARYGKDGAAVIVDEGEGVVQQWGTLFALPAVAEKGYLDVNVVVRMPGGHSSVPPKHNGIGVMAELIRAIEAGQYEPHLHAENPYLGQLECGAAHAADFPPRLRKELQHRGAGRQGGVESCTQKDRLALEAAKQSDFIKYLFTTSVAPDLISGGAKINALPERTVVTVNHRINVGDHTWTVQDRLTALARPIAEHFNLTLHAFPEGDGDGETPSSITLKEAYGTGLEPAPVSPTTIIEGETSPYSILAGTTRAVHGEELIMAPGLSTGNTDTRFYWDLTSHIFRFSPGYDPDETVEGSGIHTVDEKVSMQNHVTSVQWFSLFIRNMDETDI